MEEMMTLMGLHQKKRVTMLTTVMVTTTMAMMTKVMLMMEELRVPKSVADSTSGHHRDRLLSNVGNAVAPTLSFDATKQGRVQKLRKYFSENLPKDVPCFGLRLSRREPWFSSDSMTDVQARIAALRAKREQLRTPHQSPQIDPSSATGDSPNPIPDVLPAASPPSPTTSCSDLTGAVALDRIDQIRRKVNASATVESLPPQPLSLDETRARIARIRQRLTVNNLDPQLLLELSNSTPETPPQDLGSPSPNSPLVPVHTPSSPSLLSSSPSQLTYPNTPPTENQLPASPSSPSLSSFPAALTSTTTAAPPIQEDLTLQPTSNIETLQPPTSMGSSSPPSTEALSLLKMECSHTPSALASTSTSSSVASSSSAPSSPSTQPRSSQQQLEKPSAPEKSRLSGNASLPLAVCEISRREPDYYGCSPSSSSSSSLSMSPSSPPLQPTFPGYLATKAVLATVSVASSSSPAPVAVAQDVATVEGEYDDILLPEAFTGQEFLQLARPLLQGGRDYVAALLAEFSLGKQVHNGVIHRTLQTLRYLHQSFVEGGLEDTPDAIRTADTIHALESSMAATPSSSSAVSSTALASIAASTREILAEAVSAFESVFKDIEPDTFDPSFESISSTAGTGPEERPESPAPRPCTEPTRLIASSPLSSPEQRSSSPARSSSTPNVARQQANAEKKLRRGTKMLSRMFSKKDMGFDFSQMSSSSSSPDRFTTSPSVPSVSNSVAAHKVGVEALRSTSTDQLPKRDPSKKLLRGLSLRNLSRKPKKSDEPVAAPSLLSPRAMRRPEPISTHDRLLDDVTNVWDEEKLDKDKNLYLRNTMEEEDSPYNVRLATLNQLIALLTEEKPKMGRVQADDFTASFFGTCLCFSTHQLVFHKLVERFEIPEEVQMTATRAYCLSIQKAVLGTLRYWFVNFSAQIELQLKNDMLAFSLRVQQETKESELKISARFLEKSIVKMMETGALFSNREERPTWPEPIAPPNMWSPIEEHSILDVDPLEVARQLCIMDYRLYSKMEELEVLRRSWVTPSKSKGCHLLALISLFNTTASRFGQLVLSQSGLAARVAAISFVVRVMEYLDELNNFCSLMALLSAFDWSPVHRLQHTFDSLNPRQTQQLRAWHTLFINSNSYRNYRTRYGTVKPPAIPFAGIHLSDLTGAHDGNPDEINGLINFSKFRLIHQMTQQFLRHQKTPYPYRPLPIVQQLMEAIPIRSEEESFQLSQVLEPRGAELRDLQP